jgi:tetratricopeptide (TPR) repeat protein
VKTDWFQYFNDSQLAQHEERAVKMLTCAQGLIQDSRSEMLRFLAMLCYNFGVERFNNSRYEQAALWLKISVETYAKDQTRDRERHARSLRLLGAAAVELQQHDLALNSLQSSFAEAANPSTCILLARVLALSGRIDQAKQYFWLAVKDASLEVAPSLAAIEKLAQDMGEPALAAEAFWQLLELNRNGSPALIGLLCFARFQV